MLVAQPARACPRGMGFSVYGLGGNPHKRKVSVLETNRRRVHSSVARAADCRSAGPWLKSGCFLVLACIMGLGAQQAWCCPNGWQKKATEARPASRRTVFWRDLKNLIATNRLIFINRPPLNINRPPLSKFFENQIRRGNLLLSAVATHIGTTLRLALNMAANFARATPSLQHACATIFGQLRRSEQNMMIGQPRVSASRLRVSSDMLPASTNLQDSLAEWFKALASGASP